MFMPMQQPLSYPFHMNRQSSPTSIAWSSAPFNLPFLHQQVPFSSNFIPQPVSPFILRRPQGKSHSKNLPSSASFSNTRYHHLKQSASYSSRRPVHHSVDAAMRPRRYSSHNHFYPPQQNRSEKTRSISDFDRLSQSTSTHLSKAQSWHTMASHRSSNLSVAYAKERHLTPKRRRKQSPQKQPKMHHQRHLSLSPKRRPSFNNKHRRRPEHLPERGIVRISTLDEMPLPTNQNHSRTSSINNDRLSMKGSISNSSKHRNRPKEKTKTNRIVHNNDDNEEDEGTHVDSDRQSSSSSNDNYSILQHRLNVSLRNDPLISAAMEEFRQFRRSSSQTPSMTSHRRDLSRDSLCPNSISHSSSSPSSSNRNSQSSFTSVERLEIRQIIKSIKTKPTPSVHNPPEVVPIPLSTSASEQSLTINCSSPLPSSRPRKSSITEELDREFSKLRSLDPNQDISFVTPSSICKRKGKTLEKPPPPPKVITPVSTFGELLRKVQLRPIDKSVKPLPKKENVLVEDSYENSLLSIPVPRSSPIPVKEIPIEEPEPEPEPQPESEPAPELKHEYAIPVKKSEGKFLSQISHFQPSRRFLLTKPLSTFAPERKTSRSLSILNRFQQGLTNPFPTTFQPDRTTNKQTDYETTTSSVKENIYTSDVDVYVPLSNSDKLEDQSLQIHLENQTILTDDFYSEYTTKPKLNSSSILNDFSYLFTRKYKHQKKDQRCSIM